MPTPLAYNAFAMNTAPHIHYGQSRHPSALISALETNSAIGLLD